MSELPQKLRDDYTLETAELPGKEENVIFHLPREMIRDGYGA